MTTEEHGESVRQCDARFRSLTNDLAPENVEHVKCSKGKGKEGMDTAISEEHGESVNLIPVFFH